MFKTQHIYTDKTQYYVSKGHKNSKQDRFF